MASGALNSTQLNPSTRPSIRMFNQPPGGKSSINLSDGQDQIDEKEPVTNSTPMKNTPNLNSNNNSTPMKYNQSPNNTSMNMSSLFAIMSILMMRCTHL